MYSAILTLSNLKLVRIYNGSSNSSGLQENIVTDETALLLGVSPIEARLLYEQNTFKLSDRIKQAVLEPLNSNVDVFSDELSLI